MSDARWCPVLSLSRWDLRWAMHGLRKSGRRCASNQLSLQSKTSAVYLYLFFSRGLHGSSFSGNSLSMKCFEVTWRDESNDSRAKVDFIFDRFFIKRIGLRFLIQHPGLVAVWQSLKQDHWSDKLIKLSQLLAGHVVPCRTLKPLAIFNGFDDCTAVWTMTMTVMILCLPKDLYLTCRLFLEVSEFCWAFLAPPKASYWSRRSSWVSPTSRTGMGGGCLFCFVVASLVSDLVPLGFVCIIFTYINTLQSFPMLWMSCKVWERREIFCCLDRVFSRSSLEHCVSSEFPCLSGASGIIRSVAVGEILRAAAQEARSAVQEDFGLASLGDFERWNSCEGSWNRCIIPCKLKQGELFTQRFWIAILSLPENWRLTRWCALQGM